MGFAGKVSKDSFRYLVSYESSDTFSEHATAGRIGLVYSTLSVDGQPNLGLVIYTPATAEDEAKIAELLA
jgi:hypothetical protein